MGFHPKNGLHQGKAFYLNSLDLCFKNSGNGLKTENCKNWKLNCEKLTLKI